MLSLWTRGNSTRQLSGNPLIGLSRRTPNGDSRGRSIERKIGGSVISPNDRRTLIEAQRAIDRFNSGKLIIRFPKTLIKNLVTFLSVSLQVIAILEKEAVK